MNEEKKIVKHEKKNKTFYGKLRNSLFKFSRTIF